MKKAILLLLFQLCSWVMFAQINTDRVLTIGRNALYFEDYVLSIQYFNQVIRSKPWMAEPYFYRAVAKINLDDYKGAEEDCTLCLQRNPFLVQAYYARGIARQSQEKYDEATLERIRRMRKDPYSEVMEGYGGGKDGRFSRQLEAQLSGLEDEEALNEIIRKAKKNARIRKDLEESSAYREKMYERIAGYDKEEQATEGQPASSDTVNIRVRNTPIYLAGNGKRMRRQHSALPKSSNLIKACIHGDQTIVTGSTVRMRLLEDVQVSGMKIPANTLFYGTATLGASRLDIVINNLKVGNSINPVSFLVFDNDAMEGLNLPNNMKATAAKRMEQGLVQNIDMPLSSIGTMTSEVTSAINATTQIAKQILNMSLSQTKVHLKSNYVMYIQEESEESKLKREAIQQELQRLYSQLEQEKEKKKSHPLKTLIDKL